MPQQGVVFLMYHELEMPEHPLCRREAGYLRYVLTQEGFRAQMSWLQQAGWRGMSVSEALRLAPQHNAEQKRVAITFDDGCETDLISAAPILKDAGFNATFYVTVEFLGQPGHLAVKQLRELSSLGFEVGCHSMTHAFLTDLDDDGLRREIVASKTRLEEILEKPVEHFSCPGGRFDARAIQVARDAGYRSVTTSGMHENTRSTNRYELGRIAIFRHTSLPAFEGLCNGEGLWKLRLRNRAQDVAKRLLGNSLYDRGRALLLRGE
jgi:peptidoglycan/xylan/chitin deacetylase (PgdA/CDA1 family)